MTTWGWADEDRRRAHVKAMIRLQLLHQFTWWDYKAFDFRWLSRQFPVLHFKPTHACLTVLSHCYHCLAVIYIQYILYIYICIYFFLMLQFPSAVSAADCVPPHRKHVKRYERRHLWPSEKSDVAESLEVMWCSPSVTQRRWKNLRNRNVDGDTWTYPAGLGVSEADRCRGCFQAFALTCSWRESEGKLIKATMKDSRAILAARRLCLDHAW